MTTTVAKTYRFPAALYQLIVAEAEKTKTSEAEVVRLALRQHFTNMQDDARLNALEARILASIQLRTQRIETLINQVIALAQP
jgi:hypothetical protein